MGSISIGFLHHNSPLISRRVFLSSEEKKHLQRLSNKRKIRAFIAGRILCRFMIAELASVEAAQVRIRINDTGRPITEYPDSFFFSISHSHELSVCAAAQSSIGIDVEKRRMRQFDSISSACFHRSEEKEIQNESEESERLKKFYRYWTLKEACLKNSGRSVWEIGRLPPVVALKKDNKKQSWACCYELPGDYTLSLYSQAQVSVSSIGVFPGFGLEGAPSLDEFLVGLFTFAE